MEDYSLNKFAEVLEEFVVESRELLFSESGWPKICERQEEWCSVFSAVAQSPLLVNVVREAMSEVIFTAMEPHLEKLKLALLKNYDDTDTIVYALLNLYRHYVQCSYMISKWSEVLGTHELMEMFHSRLRVFLLREENHASLPIESFSPSTSLETSIMQDKQLEVSKSNQREQLYATQQILQPSSLPSSSTTRVEQQLSCRDLLLQFAYMHARQLLLNEKESRSDNVEANSINCFEDEEDKLFHACEHNNTASCHHKCHCLSCQVDYVWASANIQNEQQTSFLLPSLSHIKENKVSACVIYIFWSLTLCTSEDMKPMWLSLLKHCITYKLYKEETEEQEECCEERMDDDGNETCHNTSGLRKHMEWLVQIVYPFTELIFKSVECINAYGKADSTKEMRNQEKFISTTRWHQEHEHLRLFTTKSRTSNQAYMCHRWLLDELLIEFAHKQLSVMWDIIIEFPDSLAIVKDLRYCIRHTTNSELIKREITRTVQDVLASRLHKAGTRTEDIVSVLNKTIEMLSLLVERNEWSSFVYNIIHSTFVHLQGRQDCVATIVKAITETDKNSTIYSTNLSAFDMDQDDMDVASLINNTAKFVKECDYMEYSKKGVKKYVEYEEVDEDTSQGKLEINSPQKEYLEENEWEEEEQSREEENKTKYNDKQKARNRNEGTFRRRNASNENGDANESELFRSYDDIKNDMECITEGERDRVELESSRPPDVLHILLSTLSAKVIAEEYKHALATQLLSKHFNNFDVTTQEEVLERLKCVLGELALSSCAIMLHDMQSSRRLTTQLREHIKLHHELEEETRTKMELHERSNSLLAKEEEMLSYQSKREDNNFTRVHTNTNAKAGEENEQEELEEENDSSDDDSFIGRRTVCLDSSYVMPSTGNPRNTFETKNLSSFSSSSPSPQVTLSVAGMRGGNLKYSNQLHSLPQRAECHVLDIESIDITVLSATAWPPRVVQAGYTPKASINDQLNVNKNMGIHTHMNDITSNNKNRPSAGNEKLNSTVASFHIHPLLLNEMNKLNRAYRAIKAMRKLQWMYNYGCIEMEITQVETCTNTPTTTTVELSLFEASVVLYVQDAENEVSTRTTQREEEQQERFRGVPVEQLSTWLGVSVGELMLRTQLLLLHVLRQTEHGILLQPYTSDSSNIILAQVDNERNSVTDEEQVSTLVSENSAQTHTHTSKGSIAGLTIEQIKLLQTMITAMLKAGGAKSVNDIYNSMKLFGQFQGSVGDMRKVLQHLLTTNAVVLSSDGKSYCLPSK